MKSLEQLCVEVMPNPGALAREVFPLRHPLRETSERRKYQEPRERYKKLHQVNLRYVLFKFYSLGKYNWTWQLFPGHIAILKRMSQNDSSFSYSQLYQHNENMVGLKSYPNTPSWLALQDPSLPSKHDTLSAYLLLSFKTWTRILFHVLFQ